MPATRPSERMVATRPSERHLPATERQPPTDGVVKAALHGPSSGVVLEHKLPVKPVKRPYAPKRRMVRWTFVILLLLVAGGGVASYFYYPPVRAWWIEHWPF
jgi:hypothetical protein